SGKLGQALQAAQFGVEAATCYRRACELDPRSSRWAHLSGLQQLENGEEAGLGSLARAAELAGIDPDAPRLRCERALVERGRLEEARTQLQPLLRAAPAHAGAHLEEGHILLARGELAAAAASLEACLTNVHTARPATVLLSQIRQRQGDLAQAAH